MQKPVAGKAGVEGMETYFRKLAVEWGFSEGTGITKELGRRIRLQCQFKNSTSTSSPQYSSSRSVLWFVRVSTPLNGYQNSLHTRR